MNQKRAAFSVSAMGSLKRSTMPFAYWCFGSVSVCSVYLAWQALSKRGSPVGGDFGREEATGSDQNSETHRPRPEKHLAR
jgi:hypothetical protein